CSTEYLDLADIELDQARGEFRIVGTFRAAAHLAVDPHHPFRAQLFSGLECWRVRVGDALGQPVMVAQVDEQHTAVVTDAVAPARQADLLANMALAERAAGMGPVTMHGMSRNSCRRDRILRKSQVRIPGGFTRGNDGRQPNEPPVLGSKKAPPAPILSP